MARLIPPYVSDEVKSSAEKRVFELFRTDPETDSWTVIHSLGLARHVRQTFGEIDFVVLAPGEGIFCLEVKGGQVRRKEGIWTFTNRYGSVSTKTASPFMQAREGMFSLIHAVQAKFGSHHHLSRLVYRYGVMFPDIYFGEDDPEHERWEVYDLEDRRRPISTFVKRLSAAAHRAVRNTKWYEPTESRPNQKDIQDLVALLRKDFERVVPPAVMIQDTERELLRLTEEQYRCLDQLENNARCLFQGGAGTGKTLIAMEMARRDSRRGKRVLLVCYNRLLGDRISAELSNKEQSNCSPIAAKSLHRYLYDLIMHSPRKVEFEREIVKESEDLYRVMYPLYALAAIQGGVIEPFDSLIIDEGQDLIRPEYLDVFDDLVRGGLNGGRWAMFCDFHRQAIYSELSVEDMIDQIDGRVTRYARFELTVNCRNTQPIGEETALLSGFDTPPFLPANVTGPPVDYRFFSDTESERHILRDILNAICGEGVKAANITVLSPVSRSNSCLAKPLEGLHVRISDLTENTTYGVGGDAVQFSTIQSFKGLENSVIVLIDMTELCSEKNRSLLYVGMSRARHRLFVLVAQSAKTDYLSAVQNRISKLKVKR